MTTPIEFMASLRVGVVESVAPDQIKVALEAAAPQSVALNAGVPTAFPRINNYVLIPTEGAAVVGMIVWIGVTAAPTPRLERSKTIDMVDLPFPSRRMVIVPVGTLSRRRDTPTGKYRLRLERGVDSFPSVGDSVLLPSTEQLKSIIEAQGDDRRVIIGTSALSSDASVSVDPDKLFGRHLAVLGNTGSGKSCSVAGVIRWSIEAAQETRRASGDTRPCNARFIILDPNGEYGEAFDGIDDSVRRFRVVAAPPKGDAETTAHDPRWTPLRVPAWLWNSHEWCSFASAAPGFQRPLLLQGLRDMRAGTTLEESNSLRAHRLFRSYRNMVASKIADGATAFAEFPACKNVGLLLRRVAEDASGYSTDADDCYAVLSTAVNAIAQRRDTSYPDRTTGETKVQFAAFGEADLTAVIAALDVVIHECSAQATDDTTERPREDAPIPFDVSAMADHLKQLAVEVGSPNASQFADFLAMRIEMTLNDGRIKQVIHPDPQPSLIQWLEEYVGADGASNGSVAVIDLSLVPADVLQMLIAVLGRLIFETVQRYRRANGCELPTTIVLEEAHSFVRKSRSDSVLAGFAGEMCREVFERIAREGRKFGLGLVLSSQRPSELSETVLAQCNTFLLHRLVNETDQEFVKCLVPDKLGGLLADLPNLPTKQAIILGWATPVPILVNMRELPLNHRPRSADPDFWGVWTGTKERPIDWPAIAEDWTS
jgi:DNA helicase HerA-like ATPase